MTITPSEITPNAPTALPTAATQSHFVADLVGSVLWNYDEDKGRVYSLYDLAKEKTWNAATDLNWAEFSRATHFPTADEFNPLKGFDQYEQLPTEEKIRISWWRHGLEISEILHGEQGALLTAAQLVTCMPTVETKLFASSQVFDEARHVEFFSRYLQEVVGAVYEPSQELKALIEATLASPHWDIKFIACQVVIESLAMAKFQEIKHSTQVPVLQFAINYIAKDEARHVNFGVEVLKGHIASLTDAEREFRSEFVLDSVLKLANALNIYTRIGDSLRWDMAALRYHLRKFRIQNPEANRDRFRQLTINLNAVGLLTEKTKDRLSNLNLLS